DIKVLAAQEEALALALDMHAGDDVGVVAFVLGVLLVLLVLFPLARAWDRGLRALARTGLAGLHVFAIAFFSRLLALLFLRLLGPFLIQVVVHLGAEDDPFAVGRPRELPHAALCE